MTLYKSLYNTFQCIKAVFVARWLKLLKTTLTMTRHEPHGEEVSRLPHTQPFIPYTSYFIPKTKGFILLLLAIVLLTNCSDDYSFENGTGVENSDYISIDFTIPDTEHIITRAEERKDIPNERRINNLYILVFDGANKLIQKEAITTYNDNISFPNEGNESEFTIKFNKNSATKKADTQINIFAVVNTFVKISDSEDKDLLDNYGIGNSLSEFQAITNNLNYDSQNGFLMSGRMESTVGQNEIVLVRSAAKVSVKDETTAGNFRLLDKKIAGYENTKIDGFDIYETASHCYLMASIMKIPFYVQNSNHQQADVKKVESTNDNGQTINRYDVYVNPTQMHEGDNILSYIVLHGEYKEKDGQSKEGYYAIPLYSQTLQEHYDIEPNHWYDIRIIEVNHVGENSPEEAIKNPCDYVIYQIHDHTPEVLSMVSDGVHELGVERSVTLSPTKTEANFRVKWYSARKNETLNPDELKAEVIDGADWLTVTKGKSEIKTDESKTDPDNYGTQYEFTVNVVEGARFYTDQEATIRIEWKNLSREVKVLYDAGFDVAAVCDVTLYIKDENNDNTNGEKIQNYWTFLAGKGTYTGSGSDGQNHPKLYGTGTDDMSDGKIRNEGFHFPMPYGNYAPKNPWSYEYEINFDKLWKIIDERILSISVSTKNGKFFKSAEEGSSNASDANLLWKFSNTSQIPIVTLKLNQSVKSSFEYATDQVTFTVKYGDDLKPSYRYITLDLYHTGFFHFETGKGYVDDDDVGYYYYEVIKITENGENYYWLDRNIGAKSNMMYIDDQNTYDNQKGLGNPDAIGRYFTIAKPEKYDEPTIDENICPPGYHIPVTAEWNALRLSSKLITENTTDGNNYTYMSCYYRSDIIDNKQPVNIYFPKARYYNKTEDPSPPGDNQKYVSFSNMGDASSGYYWTATTAPGMEKENMGNWLRALYINGSSTTYNNADIVNHRLPVRCIAGVSAPSQDDNYISFNVHNVTHVYLFNYETGAPLYAFPGKAVSSTASSSKWQYFNSTTTADINKLAVIFTKMESNGSVTIYSRDTKEGKSFVTNRTLKQAVGDWANNVEGYYWLIKDSKDYDLFYYDFCDSAKVREGDNVSHDKPGSDDCNADSENSGSQGGDNGELKGKVTKYDPTRPNDPQTVWEGEVIFSESWSDNCQDLLNVNFNWDEVPAGTILKVYTASTGSGYNVQLKSILSDGSTWSKLDGNPDSYTNPEDNPISIKLTETILNALRSPNKGLVIYGLYYKLTKVEISPDDGSGGSSQGGENSGVSPQDPSEIIIWEGNTTIDWHPGLESTSFKIDLSKQDENSILRLYCYEASSSTGWWCIIFEYMNGDGEIGGQINNPGIYDFKLTKEILKALSEKNTGLRIKGQHCTIKLVTIRPGN